MQEEMNGKKNEVEHEQSNNAGHEHKCEDSIKSKKMEEKSSKNGRGLAKHKWKLMSAFVLFVAVVSASMYKMWHSIVNIWDF